MVRKDAKSSIRHAMLAVVLLVAGTSSAAFGDQTSAGVAVLRGTPARVECKRRSKNPSLKRPVGPVAPE